MEWDIEMQNFFYLFLWITFRQERIKDKISQLIKISQWIKKYDSYKRRKKKE